MSFYGIYHECKGPETTQCPKWMMIGIFVLLLITLVIGKNINGSKSWINLGFMNLQASELLKIAIILYLPFMIEKCQQCVIKLN